MTRPPDAPRRRALPGALRLPAAALLGAAAWLAGAPAAAQGDEPVEPGPVRPDRFHPDVDPEAPAAAPAYGGGIVIHIANLPRGLNRVVENSSVARWIHYALHESLLHQDWETWELVPRLAEGWVTEDTLVLSEEGERRFGDVLTREAPRADEEAGRAVLFGEVTPTEDGFRLVPRSPDHPLREELEVPAACVDSVERGTVFTFDLRRGVRWHDGHPFDAGDVLFSWQCFQNPYVAADQTRSLYAKVRNAELLGPHRIRFFYATQFYSALETVGEMTILPRHLYDLRDPDHRALHPELHAERRERLGADHVPTDEEVGAYVNENRHNTEWVGLGPYRITAWEQQFVEAERFDGYWDAADPRFGGYLDRIRWRHIPSDDTAFEALLAGEIDLHTRLSAETFFGAAVESERFRESFYKGHYYTGSYTYVGWNQRRPFFEDVRVRRALAHAVDVQAFIDTQLKGLGRRVTGPPSFFSPTYDRTVAAPGFDPARAVELLEQAGWYDRDGDGVRDRDGQPFSFEYLYHQGNTTYRALGLRLQEALGAVGVRVRLVSLEWATLLDRVLGRDFDSVVLAWIPDIESDPEQIWHSRWADRERSSNFVSYRDDATDRAIEALQRELDPARRREHWHAYHRRVDELQPYLFAFNTPRKFAFHKRFRGFRTSLIPPGYDLRRIHLPAGSPGTRSAPDR